MKIKKNSIITQYLVNKKVNLPIINYGLNNYLYIITYFNKKYNVKELKFYNSECNKYIIAWNIAYIENDYEIIDYIISNCINKIPNSEINNALNYSYQKNYLYIIKKLLELPQCNKNIIIIKNNEKSERVKLLKYYRIIYFYRSINKIICLQIIKNFIIKYILLHPNSIYIKRITNY